MAAVCRKTVGVRFPRWYSFAPETLGGVVDFMRGHEMWRLVTENDSHGEMEAVRIEADWRGDGLILFRATEAELENHRRRGTAVVLTSTEGPDLGFPRVVSDNSAIGAVAARHLLGCGLADFAFLARGETFYREAAFAPGFRVYARERLHGFRAELAACSIQPLVHYLRGRPLWEDRGWREIQCEVSAYLETLPKPCGLFVVDDSLAAVALRAAEIIGRKVPSELAVIGYGDDHAYCYSSFPVLSSIDHPAREIGRRAAELLWRQMAGEKVAGVLTVPPGEVRARESSDCLMVADPVIRDAVAWIRTNAGRDPIRVSDLAERSGLSLTTLKDRFARHLGHSPKLEIQLARLGHLKRLLRQPEVSLVEIARRMGFATSHELGRFFKAATGMRPSAYRKAHAYPNWLHAPAGYGLVFQMDGTLFDADPPARKALMNTLEWLRQRRVPMALASTRDRAETGHALLLNAMAVFFEVVVCGEDVAQDTADPGIVGLASRRLGIPARSCALITDSAEGVMRARTAGMRAILIGNETPREADHMFYADLAAPHFDGLDWQEIDRWFPAARNSLSAGGP